MENSYILSEIPIFQGITKKQRCKVYALMREVLILSGEDAIVEGDDSDTLFVIVRGAFAVQRTGQDMPIAFLEVGDLIGEIGFFGNIPYTTTVTAIRDSSVLSLSRAAYETIAREMPSIADSLIKEMALRVADTTSRMIPNRQILRTRTVVILEGGREQIPKSFYKLFRQVLDQSNVRVVTSRQIIEMFPGANPDEGEVTNWLHEIERTSDLVVYLGDRELTPLTHKFIRQSDHVVFLCRGEAPAGQLTEIEFIASTYHGARERRLVRVHDMRSGEVYGTRAWLNRLPVFMHHHVSLQDDIDIRSLVRFLQGRAIGFVAAGGGALGSAHVGVYEAFRESGVVFDIFVGTSVGAAVTAGFAKNFEAKEFNQRADDIFVKNRSFKRLTWPMYSLLDHKVFDRSLAETLGENCNIEDCWRPFAAIATNLSTQTCEVIRSGLLWHAVRASTAIPGILPPFYTKDGSILVDGGLFDNIPLAPMHDLKHGPNVVIHFGERAVERVSVDYDSLPGRRELITGFLLPFRNKRFPQVPNIINILWRSLVVHQRDDLIPANTSDCVLCPPAIANVSFMDFDSHIRISDAAYVWMKSKIERAEEDRNSALLSILSYSRQL